MGNKYLEAEQLLQNWMSFHLETHPFKGILWRVWKAGNRWVFGASHFLAGFSSTLLEKRLTGSQPLLCCSQLAYMTPVVSIGHGSAEEILLLADSHWSFLNDSQETIICTNIWWEVLWDFFAKKVDSFLSVQIGVSAFLNWNKYLIILKIEVSPSMKRT